MWLFIHADILYLLFDLLFALTRGGGGGGGGLESDGDNR